MVFIIRISWGQVNLFLDYFYWIIYLKVLSEINDMKRQAQEAHCSNAAHYPFVNCKATELV